MAIVVDCCPVCYCQHTIRLEVTGGEWVGLIIPRLGGVKPKVCLNCGTVYVSMKDINYINRGKNDG